MTANLTFLTVTNYGSHAEPFLCAHRDLADQLGARVLQFDGRGARCLEDVHDAAVEACAPGYILRLDDDELPSQTMGDWLDKRAYEAHDHWAFPRLNLYPDETSFISNMWPDLQTRLSVKQKAGGRNEVHVGSPFGPGQTAPVAIEHWKFLCRPLEERRALVKHYEAIKPGAGNGFRAFSVPEDIPDVQIAPVAEAAISW